MKLTGAAIRLSCFDAKALLIPMLVILPSLTLSCKPRLSKQSSTLAASSERSFDTRESQKAIMESSREPLAQLADALGYAYASGCKDKRPGGDMAMSLEAPDGGSWTARYDASAACGPTDQDPKRRLKIKYKFYESIKAFAPLFDQKRLKKAEAKQIDRIVYGAQPTARNATPRKTYNLENSLSIKLNDELRSTAALPVELKPESFGGKAPVTFMLGKGAAESQLIPLDGSAVEVSENVAIPQQHCAVVEVMRSADIISAPFTMSVHVQATAELSGFLRGQSCGGNFHKALRGNTTRPEYSYFLGRGGLVPFWNAVLDHKQLNNSEFNYRDAMASRDCSDHGAAIDEAVAKLKRDFIDAPIHILKMRGTIEHIQGTRIYMVPHVYPEDSPACKDAN